MTDQSNISPFLRAPLRSLAQAESDIAARREAQGRCGHIAGFRWMPPAAREGAPKESPLPLDEAAAARRFEVALKIRAIQMGLAR